MPESVLLFSGLSSELSVPAGGAANASLVGPNTVNGPGPDSVSTSPAALTAATSVEKSGLLEATCTMFCETVGAVVAEAIGDEAVALPQAASSIPAAAAATHVR